MSNDNGEFSGRTYDAYRMLMREIGRLGKDIEEISKRVDRTIYEELSSMKTDIAVLKFQAMLYGAIAGFIATGIVALVVRLVK